MSNTWMLLNAYTTVNNMSWCCICSYLSLNLITNNVLVSMGCRFFSNYYYFFLFFFLDYVYICHFLHQPIKAMGDIFQWVVRFQPWWFSPAVFFCCSAGVWGGRGGRMGYFSWNVDNSTQKYMRETSLTSDLTVWGF